VLRLPTLLLVLVLATAALATTASAERVAVSQQRSLDRQLLGQVNALRARHGLRPLRLSHPLAAAATRHSLEMIQRGYFSHASGDGSAYWKRIRHFYPSAGFHSWAVGENLAWESPGLRATDAIAMWMASPRHRAVLLDRSWREIGISAVRSELAPGLYGRQPVTLITTDFGARSKSS
jgi:uncharacterized protein YkwD